MDDVTFCCNGRDAGKGWQHSASVTCTTGAESDMLVMVCFLLKVVDTELQTLGQSTVG